jgi:hypothetical protein
MADAKRHEPQELQGLAMRSPFLVAVKMKSGEEPYFWGLDSDSNTGNT